MSGGGWRCGCRCCGIESPDVGFTADGDLLCDRCEAELAEQIKNALMDGFVRARAARMCDHGEMPGRCAAFGCAHRRTA